MNILEEVRKALKAEYDSGLTQEELSKKYNISQNHLSNLLNKKRNISLDLVQKIFPNATISLHGDTIKGKATAHGGVAIGNNFGGSIDCEARINSILDKIMTSDLDSESKVKVFNIFRESKQ